MFDSEEWVKPTPEDAALLAKSKPQVTFVPVEHDGTRWLYKRIDHPEENVNG